MKRAADLHITRDTAVSLAAALVLHFVVLYIMWNCHAIPLPTEALTVFVNLANPPSPASQVERVTPKPVPEKRAAPFKALSDLPKPVPGNVQLTSPTEPLAAPLLAPTTQTPVSEPFVTRSVSLPVSNPGTDTVPQPITLSGELSVSCPDRSAPVYPRQSSRLGEQGKTVLQVELDERGRVITVAVKTTSGFPRLDEAAVNAVKSWRCSPAKRNGAAVRSVALQPFNFTLKGR